MDALDAIFARRSIGRLGPPAPSEDELRTILAAATAAPDHESLRPWRFVVLEGAAKDAFGEVLRDTFLARCHAAGTEPTVGQVEKERTKLGRAPVVVVVAAVTEDDPVVPRIEQRDGAVAAAENILLAATALGYGSMWRTGDAAYDPAVADALGLGNGADVVGFLYLGTPRPGPQSHPPRRGFDDVVTWWRPPA